MYKWIFLNSQFWMTFFLEAGIRLFQRYSEKPPSSSWSQRNINKNMLNTADFIEKVLGVYTHSMETICLSPVHAGTVDFIKKVLSVYAHSMETISLSLVHEEKLRKCTSFFLNRKLWVYFCTTGILSKLPFQFKE